MSEEQPIFKVTDRRLFNPDGSPREIEREEETKKQPAAAESREAAPLASESSISPAPQAGEMTGESVPLAPAAASPARTAQKSALAENPAEAAAASAQLGNDVPAGWGSAESSAEVTTASTNQAGEIEQFPEEDYADSDIPGADDPTSFINFLMSIASNAAASLGMMEHPVTGQRTVDPELAKHWIDVLGMLQQKTRGNLAPQEQQIFEGLLADLRMQYVSLSGASQPKAPRGFSGSDITGGR